jgi:hypothetical protein
MKATKPLLKTIRLDQRTRKIVKALRDARKEAIKIARMHGVPITYLKNGKLIRERV